MKVADTKEIKQIIGKNVGLYMAKRKIAAIPLAASLDVTRQYIYAIKSGRANVSVELLEAIALALDVDTKDLLKNGRRRAS